MLRKISEFFEQKVDKELFMVFCCLHWYKSQELSSLYRQCWLFFPKSELLQTDQINLSYWVC